MQTIMTSETPPPPIKTGLKKGIYVLPSLFTTASLFCAFYSITESIAGNHIKAVWLIFFAGILDLFDGRVARLTNTHTSFGVQYDSLIDLISFGAAPAILVFTYSLNSHFHRLGWGAAFFFFTCGALRLARFNVTAPKIEKRFFQGLPIPMAAYVLTSTILFAEHLELTHNRVFSYVLLSLTLFLSFLMVSKVHYRSFKQIDLSKPQSFLILVGVVLAIFFAASTPEYTFFCVSVSYMLLGIIDEILHLKKRRFFLAKFSQKTAESPSQQNESVQEK